MSRKRDSFSLSNFDGEPVRLTRDLYEFASRRKKTVLKRLLQIAHLTVTSDQETLVYKDERQRVLGLVTLRRGEVWVDGNSIERADRISREVRAACGDLLTFSRRLEHDEVMASAPAQASQGRPLLGSLDEPIEGLGKSMRQLLEDPDTRAQLQAQMPPGVDLARMLEAEGDDDALLPASEEHEGPGFQQMEIRLDLLANPPGGYWLLRVPDWISLGDLHRIFSTLLGRSQAAEDYAFAFPDAQYESRVRSHAFPDSYALRRAFQEHNDAFYRWNGTEWVFQLRLARLFSFARASVELVRTEIYPPGDCSSPADYQQLLEAGELPRSEPFEALERRLLPYADPTASSVGPYWTHAMTLPQVLFALLLEQGPATVYALEGRAAFTDYVGEVTLAAVRRTVKRAPFIISESSVVSLDGASPSYARMRKVLENHRMPQGPRLVAKRYPGELMSVQGRPTDVVLVVDDARGLVHASEVCSRTDRNEPLIRAVTTALEKAPECQVVVIDDLYARQELGDRVSAYVEWRRHVDEPREAFEKLEQHVLMERAGGGYGYPAGLSQTELAAFSAAAQRFYLSSPWFALADQELFEIDGLTPAPLIASILGQAHQVYGLSLFEDLGKFQAFLDGDTSAQHAFMEYLEGTLGIRPREQLQQHGIPLLDSNTVPFLFCKEGPGQASHYRLMTEALHVLCERLGERGATEPGSTVERDTKGRAVRLTYPIDASAQRPVQTPGREKLGRNDPCWCGSGKKYKKCHYELDGR